MSKIQVGGASDAAAAKEVHRLCEKIADQVDKGQWWNAMANAAELVSACQLGCRSEITRVAAKRSSADKRPSAEKKKKKGKKKKGKK